MTTVYCTHGARADECPYCKQAAVTLSHMSPMFDEDPVPLRPHRTPIPFPVDSLPEPYAPMVEAVAEFTQTDPAMPGSVCLAAIAAAATGAVLVQARPGWEEPVSLYSATSAVAPRISRTCTRVPGSMTASSS